MTDYSDIITALVAGDADKVCSLVQTEVDNGIKASEILSTGLINGMDIVGDKMQSGDMFIPEVLMAAMAMGKAVEILKPLLGEDESSSVGHIVVGTVKGDLHDIGKNLVSMMVGSTGFEVTDLGVDVSPEDFVKAVQEKNATIVALSALLTTTMPMMKKTIDALHESGLGDQVKILVGGAPVTQAFADEIGADGYAADAGSAAKLAKSYA
ncbi:corrinoid protein [Desulfobacterales bacterium HSG17]|nr:corrinoid protein [Desulfobacterales bacterium HSG17]